MVYCQNLFPYQLIVFMPLIPSPHVTITREGRCNVSRPAYVRLGGPEPNCSIPDSGDNSTRNCRPHELQNCSSVRPACDLIPA